MHKIHIVHAGSYYSQSENRDKLKGFVSAAIKKYNLPSVMLTYLNMSRHHLVTKEMVDFMLSDNEEFHFMSSICPRLNPSYTGYTGNEQTVNDEIESFFEDIQLGREPISKSRTYFLPKLTEKELQLVAKKDRVYLQSLLFREPHVPEGIMKMSESRSRYVRGVCERRTIELKNQMFQNPISHNWTQF